MNAETAEEKPTLAWQVDALVQWRREIDTKIRAVLDKAMTAMGMKSERGPKDFEQEPDVDRVIRLAAERAARTAINIRHYSEGGEGGKGETWQKWMLMLAGVLAASGVVALVGMYGRLSAIEANQVNQQSQISELKGDVKQLLLRPK